MGMLITTAVLLAITFLAIRSHLRGRKATDGPGAKGRRRCCPRCHAAISENASTCGACGVPLQAFELVSANVVQSGDGTAPAGGALHAVVRGDVCVGCGLCVPACPEPGAVTMAGKRAVIDPNLCKAHGKCVEACPVGGIFLSTGDAVQRVEVPHVDVNFQTNVPGLYIVGELGGRGLIKNAVNEGKIAIEHVAREIAAATTRTGDDPLVYDVLIVGTGPAGLSAGLQAKRSELKYVVLERGTVADTIRKYPRHKLLLAEPVRMPLYGDLWIADASKESLLKVWEAIIAETKLNVLTGHEVTRVEKTTGGFLVEAGGRPFRARRVVLAMGRRGTPRRLNVPGEDLAKVVYDVAEMEVFRGRRVLVVGGGDSAVESALGLSNQPGTEVTVSYRGEAFARVKARNQTKLDAAVGSGKVRVLLNSQVREIRHDVVIVDVSGRSTILPNDDVIVRIGGEPPQAFLERVGVRMVRKDVPIASGEAKTVA
jgi:putative YpdA family bacillithiol system oxidoreductase